MLKKELQRSIRNCFIGAGIQLAWIGTLLGLHYSSGWFHGWTVLLVLILPCYWIAYLSWTAHTQWKILRSPLFYLLAVQYEFGRGDDDAK